jgi:uncharacterized membrane protein
MGKSRLEAFSDGVLAIIITIMVLELKVPHGETWAVLRPLWGVFLGYVLSFVYLGIYWNNHHHLFHTVRTVSAGILWANLHLLFWLSLVPFVTGWAGENRFAPVPTVLYGVVLTMAALAYLLLQRAIIAAHGSDSTLHRAIGTDWKGQASFALYVVGVAAGYRWPAVAWTIYALVAAIWLLPDPRIERALHAERAER